MGTMQKGKIFYPSLEFAVLTGVLRIAKESIFSDLQIYLERTVSTFDTAGKEILYEVDEPERKWIT